MTTLFTKHGCSPCQFTKQLLNKHNINFQEINVEENPESLETIKNLGYLQVPVVITSTGEHWSGVQPDKIEALV